MNKTKLAIAVAMATGVIGGTAAYADPVIGFDPNGTAGASGWFYATSWVDSTDTGVDVNTARAPSQFAIGDVHEFHTQLRVNQFLLGGLDNTPDDLNKTPNALHPNRFELTKVISFQDQVATIDGGTPAGVVTAPTSVTFSQLSDPYTNLQIFYDGYNGTSDQSRADPGVLGSPGTAGTVNCYGTSTPLLPAPGGAPCTPGTAYPDNGQVNGPLIGSILTGNLINNVSGFQHPGGTGVGSFDLLFEVTSYNHNYLDLSNLPINQGTGNPVIGIRLTGTLTQPTGAGVPVPATAWDGVPYSGNTVFKIDSSEAFIAPEPSSLVILGTGLLTLASGIFRRKKG